MTPFKIYEFRTKYISDPKDPAKLICEDWVEYGPIGFADKSKISEKVSRLMKVADIGENANPAVQMAHDRANFIRSSYEAWKQGQELPEHGTPLAAWNGIRPEQAEALRLSGIKTVEDVAQMTETHITGIKVPGLRDLKKQAQNFLDSADQTRFAARLAEKDEEVARLKAENIDRDEEMRLMREQMAELRELALAKADDDVGYDSSDLDALERLDGTGLTTGSADAEVARQKRPYRRRNVEAA